MKIIFNQRNFEPILPGPSLASFDAKLLLGTNAILLLVLFDRGAAIRSYSLDKDLTYGKRSPDEVCFGFEISSMLHWARAEGLFANCSVFMRLDEVLLSLAELIFLFSTFSFTMSSRRWIASRSFEFEVVLESTEDESFFCELPLSASSAFSESFSGELKTDSSSLKTGVAGADRKESKINLTSFAVLVSTSPSDKHRDRIRTSSEPADPTWLLQNRACWIMMLFFPSCWTKQKFRKEFGTSSKLTLIHGRLEWKLNMLIKIEKRESG